MSEPVRVELRNHYGSVKAYPVNEAGRALAAIAGTRTLAPEIIALANRLGVLHVAEGAPSEVDKYNGRIYELASTIDRRISE